jgi:hypothetical protein
MRNFQNLRDRQREKKLHKELLISFADEMIEPLDYGHKDDRISSE